jgi:hypothetical protein
VLIPYINEEFVSREAIRAGPPRSARGSSGPPFTEIAGVREEDLVEMAKLLAARGSDPLRIEAARYLADLDSDLYETGGLLTRPDATLAGPTFDERLDATD